MAAVSLENWEERIRDPKVECMSSDEMAALQSKRLVDVVKRVYDHVDFYHKKMKETGVEPGDIRSIEDINKLPFTTKEDLRANYPFGLLAIPQSDVVRVQGTSGTTGKLTIAPYSQKDVEVWGECVARCLTMAGLTKDDILHVCYGYGLFTGGLGLDFGARALGAMTIPMSAGNTKRQMMVMEDLGATAFACTPSYALYLAESIQEAGLTDRLKIRAGIHGAEPWTEEMRKKIENILHINCFDIYGLCEINREDIKKARLIANPGCYPTCSTLSIYPMAKEGLIEMNSVIIDAKSGTSGAGRGAKVNNLYCEVNENIKAYGVATHRHTPEIEDQLSYASGEEVLLNFTPHLIPMNRGILVTAYATLKKDVSYEEVKAIYDSYYKNEKFVRVLDKDVCPETRWVEGSNYVDVNFKIDKRTNRIIMMGAMDNLVKGAAGQAVQNMNLMFGLKETEGLELVPMFP